MFWAVMVAGALVLHRSAARNSQPPVPTTPFQVRRLLHREIQPIKLANCKLERFGEAYDGGYLVCANLLGGVRSAYSYGISGYDGWGCDVSRRLDVTVHQYDCFNLTRPVCEGGATIFHGECIGTVAGLPDGRPFDTLANQIAKNGDRGKHLVVKMDVEGAEWDSFIDAPDDVLQRIDQLVVEFHGLDQPRYLVAMRKLKQFFYVAHLHWNNYSCVGDQHPFPAWAYEILLVNKRIAVPDPSGTVVLPHPLDAPNHQAAPECLAAPATSKD
jgi:hypothetical protein